MDALYRNIGKKLKSLAECIFLLGFASSVIIFIYLLSEKMVKAGLIVLVVGFASSFVSTWSLYAFGELVSRVCSIDDHLRTISMQNHEQTKRNPHEEQVSTMGMSPAMSSFLAEQERTRRKAEWDAELQRRKEAEDRARQVVEERMRRKAEERAQKESGEN